LRFQLYGLGASACATVGVSSDLYFREAGRLRVEGKEAAHKLFSVSDYELQGLVRLKRSYDSREHAQDTSFASGGGQLGGRGFRI
jgi:hypothetical protein